MKKMIMRCGKGSKAEISRIENGTRDIQVATIMKYLDPMGYMLIIVPPMTIKLIKSVLLIFISALSNDSLLAQTFEGWITYKMEAINPDPAVFPDSKWKEALKQQFGERGYMVQKYYYKKSKYISEVDAGNQQGFQAFNTKDKLLYTWQNNSDTVITVDSKKYLDRFVEITPAEFTDTILGIPCKSVYVKSMAGKMTLWYNSDYFKMDAKFYKGHIYGHWEQILKHIGCLPLKMEQKGFMSHIVQTAVEYKTTPVDDKQFNIPKFKVIIENPVN